MARRRRLSADFRSVGDLDSLFLALHLRAAQSLRPFFGLHRSLSLTLSLFAKILLFNKESKILSQTNRGNLERSEGLVAVVTTTTPCLVIKSGTAKKLLNLDEKGFRWKSIQFDKELNVRELKASNFVRKRQKSIKVNSLKKTYKMKAIFRFFYFTKT